MDIYILMVLVDVVTRIVLEKEEKTPGETNSPLSALLTGHHDVHVSALRFYRGDLHPQLSTIPLNTSNILAKPTNGFIQFALVPTRNRHIGTFCDETMRCGEANAAGTTCGDSNLCPLTRFSFSLWKRLHATYTIWDRRRKGQRPFCAPYPDSSIDL